MVTLQVKNSIKLPIDKSILLKAAQTSLDLLGSSGKSDLSIVLGDDSLLRKLNHRYRGIDSTTDVLSFPAGEVDPDTADIYLGDVIISLPRAKEQASVDGHLLSDELQLLVIHGTLHLLGYDHMTEVDKEKMQAAQDHILKSLGLSLVITL